MRIKYVGSLMSFHGKIYRRPKEGANIFKYICDADDLATWWNQWADEVGAKRGTVQDLIDTFKEEEKRENLVPTNQAVKQYIDKEVEQAAEEVVDILSEDDVMDSDDIDDLINSL